MTDEDNKPRDGIAILADAFLALLLGIVFGALGWVLWPLLRYVTL